MSPEMPCPRCGAEMAFRATAHRTVQTPAGETVILSLCTSCRQWVRAQRAVKPEEQG